MGFVVALAFVFPAMVSAQAANPQDGVLASVAGKVSVTGKDGAVTVAKNGTRVQQGDKISTQADGNAELRLFDGSQLTISPNTQFTLEKMQKPSTSDKVLSFKLFVGKVFAQVKKLTSAKSSFEIEAGGVVCGVRGTSFFCELDPAQNRFVLQVVTGVVSTQFNGQTNLYYPGQSFQLINGKPVPLPATNAGGTGAKTGTSTTPPAGAPVVNVNVNLDDVILTDTNLQLLNNLLVNGNNTFTDPRVEGALHLNVHANVPGFEGVP